MSRVMTSTNWRRGCAARYWRPTCCLIRSRRFIYRPTALYSLILRRALHPAYVRDGADFGLQFEILARKLLDTPDKPITWPLLQAEMASLWKLDIPRFAARGDENVLRLGPENL